MTLTHGASNTIDRIKKSLSFISIIAQTLLSDISESRSRCDIKRNEQLRIPHQKKRSHTSGTPGPERKGPTLNHGKQP